MVGKDLRFHWGSQDLCRTILPKLLSKGLFRPTFTTTEFCGEISLQLESVDSLTKVNL